MILFQEFFQPWIQRYDNHNETVKDSFTLRKKGSDVIRVHRADAEVIANHGRIEERFIEIMSAEKLKNLIDPRWINLTSIRKITYTRT